MPTMEPRPSSPEMPSPSIVGHSQESVEQLGDAIAELSARLTAATYELLTLIREFDRREGWTGGFASCAHWLSWRIGLGVVAAREKVRVAHALARLPLVSAAMQRGEISYSKVRAVSRVATPDTEHALLDVARSGTASHVEQIVRAWRRVDRSVAAQENDERHLRRQLQTWVDENGMVVIRGRLAPEVGAVLLRALDAAADQLRRDSAGAATGMMADEITAEQRRADALGFVAECALSASLDAGQTGDRYQVVVHLDDDALRSNADNGHATLEDPATHASAEAARRMACDASVVRMYHDRDGHVLDVGRKRRTVPPAIRRALAARDRRCRFPGCQARRCDAHHVQHWADGGATSLDNLVLLCRRHHRAVHEDGLCLTRDRDGAIHFALPDGRVLPPAPDAPPWQGAPLGPTSRHLDDAGIRIHAHTATPHWDGAHVDLDWAIDVLHPAARSPGRDSAEARRPDALEGASRPAPPTGARRGCPIRSGGGSARTATISSSSVVPPRFSKLS